MTLKVFVLDDDPERQDRFAERFRDAFVVQAWNALEAFALLSAWPRFDVWFLDHDLGTGGTAPRGSLATWPRHSPPWEVTCLKARAPDRVVVHSWNAAGAKAMRDVLSLAQFADVVGWRFNSRELREREWKP